MALAHHADGQNAIIPSLQDCKVEGLCGRSTGRPLPHAHRVSLVCCRARPPAVRLICVHAAFLFSACTLARFTRQRRASKFCLTQSH